MAKNVNPARQAGAPTARWRLDRRARKVVLLLHVMAAGTWFGLDVAMAILVVTAGTTSSTGTRSAALQMLQVVTIWPMFTAASVSLVSGLLLGLSSKYGLLRYWWVVVKLGVNLLFGVLVVTALNSGVSDAAVVGRSLAAGTDTAWDASTMAYPPIVSPIGLGLAFVLSVFKPWGRIRRVDR